MAHDPRTRRVVLLGVIAGLGLLLLEATEARFGLGGVTSLIALVPIGLSLALAGPGGGAVGALAAVSGVAVLVGGSAAVMVALRHVLPGLTLGLALRYRAGLAVSLLAVGATSVLGLTLLVWLYVPDAATPLTLLRRQMEAHAAQIERLPGRLGLARDPAVARESARLLTAAMAVAGPAVLLLGVLATAVANYVAARLLLRGTGFRPFAAEAVPDHLVWGVIGAGALVLSRQETAVMIGWNALIVLAGLYAIQGLAVLRHFLQKARVPRPLQGVSFGLFVLQPLLLVAAACLGLSDLWADFRKIRQAATPA